MLRANGAEMEPNVTVRILELSETRAYLPLPTEPYAVEAANAWGQPCLRVLDDHALKARLMAEPAAMLTEAGITVAAGVELEVMGASDTEGYFMLPPTPEV